MSFPKTLIRCFLSAKYPMCSGVSSKGSHSAALPLSSPMQLAWIGECVTVGTMQGVGREGVVGGACLSRSGDF